MNTYLFHSKSFIVSRVSEDIKPGYCTSPNAAAEIFRAIYQELDLDREHFVMLALNAKGRVIGHKVISTGHSTACLVTPAMVFQAALVLGAVTVLVAHNHPSGDPSPSREDEELTLRLREAGKLLGVPLGDHLVLGFDSPDSVRSHSFRAKGEWDNALA